MNAIFKEQRDTLQAARLGLLLLLYVILSRRRRTTSGMTEQQILAGCDKFKVFTCRPRPSHSRQGDPVAFPSAPADIGSGRRKRSTGHGGCALLGVRTRNTGLVLGLGHFFHTLFTLRMYIQVYLLDGRTTLFVGQYLHNASHLHKLFTHNACSGHSSRPRPTRRPGIGPLNMR